MTTNAAVARGGNSPAIEPAVLKRIYREMARISAVDTAIRQGLAAGRFMFNYWPMTGQEAIPACLSPLLTRDDYLVTTYRGVHDHVAKGVPQELAEGQRIEQRGLLLGGRGRGRALPGVCLGIETVREIDVVGG